MICKIEPNPQILRLIQLGFSREVISLCLVVGAFWRTVDEFCNMKQVRGFVNGDSKVWTLKELNTGVGNSRRRRVDLYES